jgi:hypothetical protein
MRTDAVTEAIHETKTTAVIMLFATLRDLAEVAKWEGHAHPSWRGRQTYR